MKNLRHLCVAITLMCAFTLPAFAGIMDYPVASPTTATATTASKTYTSTTSTAIDPAAQALLQLLQSILAHF